MAKLHEQIPKIQRRQFREDDNEAMVSRMRLFSPINFIYFLGKSGMELFTSICNTVRASQRQSSIRYL